MPENKLPESIAGKVDVESDPEDWLDFEDWKSGQPGEGIRVIIREKMVDEGRIPPLDKGKRRIKTKRDKEEGG